VILSDIGANSILLAPQTFEQSQAAPNRLAVIERYVRDGGGLLMIGGYLSFAGIEGKARYHGTPVEDALPVLIDTVDDRVETPQGVIPGPVAPGHPLLDGVAGPWPALLGYNRVTRARPPRWWCVVATIRSWSSAITTRAEARSSPPTAPRTGPRPRS